MPRIDSRENESIPVDPAGILRVEGHELVEEDVGGRGQAHRGARMAGVGLGGGIDLYASTMLLVEAPKDDDGGGQNFHWG